MMKSNVPGRNTLSGGGPGNRHPESQGNRSGPFTRQAYPGHRNRHLLSPTCLRTFRAPLRDNRCRMRVPGHDAVSGVRQTIGGICSGQPFPVKGPFDAIPACAIVFCRHEDKTLWGRAEPGTVYRHGHRGTGPPAGNPCCITSTRTTTDSVITPGMLAVLTGRKAGIDGAVAMIQAPQAVVRPSGDARSGATNGAKGLTCQPSPSRRAITTSGCAFSRRLAPFNAALWSPTGTWARVQGQITLSTISNPAATSSRFRA